MRVIKRNAQRFRLVTLNSSSFSPLSYMDLAQNRKALRQIHFSAVLQEAPCAGGYFVREMKKSEGGKFALPRFFYLPKTSCAAFTLALASLQ